MKHMKKVLCMVLSFILALEVMPAPPAGAASKDTISVKKFVKELEELIGTGEALFEEGEYDLSGKLTWKEAAVLANRADVLMNGSSYDEELYKQVKGKKRLVGLSGLTAAERKAARLCFVKGIIAGESMGTYSQARKLYTRKTLTKKEADKLLERLGDKTKRIKLSPDGQVTRSTNLPKNYKQYDYILASFPNEFYENKYFFERVKYGRKQERYQDWSYPKDMKKLYFVNPRGEVFDYSKILPEYTDMWMEKVKTNLECRLNFDYRTVDNEWISKLRATYFVYGNAEMDKIKTDRIKKYVAAAKKNHVIVTADKIVVEPSSMYFSDGLKTVRCYVRFKVSADTIYSASSMKQQELVYSSSGYQHFNNLKNNTWYEGFFDIQMGSNMGYGKEDTSVNFDSKFYEPGK